MNKTSIFKRMLISVLAIAMVLTAIPMTTVTAQAAPTAIKKVVIKQGKKNVTKKTINLAVGKSSKIKVVVTPSSAKKSIKYVSGNKKVATVSKSGKIKAKAAGTTKIKVTVTGKNKKKKTAWVKVKVTGVPTEDTPSPQPSNSPAPSQAPAPQPSVAPSQIPAPSQTPGTVEPTDASQISFNVKEEDTTLVAGADTQLNVSFPEGVSSQITWTSSDPTVATVDASGKVMTLKDGNVTITATTANGIKKDITFTVTKKNVPPTGLTLSSTEEYIVVGKSVTLTATIVPADAKTDVIWSSNDTTKATVKDGVVNGISEGDAIITATTVTGGISATCTVHVSKTERQEVNIKETVTQKEEIEGHSNVVMAGDTADIALTVTDKKGQPIGKKTLNIYVKVGAGNATIDGNNCLLKGTLGQGEYKTITTYTGDNESLAATVTTDEKGQVSLTMGLTDQDGKSIKPTDDIRQSYWITVKEPGNTGVAYSFNISFASLYIPSLAAFFADDYYTTSATTGVDNKNVNVDYVTKQQVGTTVNMDMTPYIYIPKSANDSNKKTITISQKIYYDRAGTAHKSDEKFTSGNYFTYNGENNYSTTVDVELPAGLSNASFNFTKYEISEYSKLDINFLWADNGEQVYNSQTGKPMHVEKTGETSSETSVQIQSLAQADTKNKIDQRMVARITIRSEGQVNAGKNGGYEFINVVGTFKEGFAGGYDLVELTDAITFEPEEVKYDIDGATIDVKNIASYIKETDEQSAELVRLIKSGEIKPQINVPTYTYSSGNAIMILKHEQTNQIFYYAFPTKRSDDVDKKNKNILVDPDDYSNGAIKLSEEAATKYQKGVFTKDEEDGSVNITSDKVGITGIEATLSSPLFCGIFGGENKLVIHTSIQWVLNDTVETMEKPESYYLLKGQSAKITAKIYNTVGSTENPVENGTQVGLYQRTYENGRYEDTLVPNQTKATDKDGYVTFELADANSNTDETYTLENLVVKEINPTHKVRTFIQKPNAASNSNPENDTDGYEQIPMSQSSDDTKLINLYWVSAGLYFKDQVDVDNINNKSESGKEYISYTKNNMNIATLKRKVGENWVTGFKILGDVDKDTGFLVTNIDGLSVAFAWKGYDIESSGKNECTITETKAGDYSLLSYFADPDSQKLKFVFTLMPYRIEYGEDDTINYVPMEDEDPIVVSSIGHGSPQLPAQMQFKVNLSADISSAIYDIILPAGSNLDKSSENRDVYVTAKDKYGNAFNATNLKLYINGDAYDLNDQEYVKDENGNTGWALKFKDGVAKITLPEFERKGNVYLSVKSVGKEFANAAIKVYEESPTFAMVGAKYVEDTGKIQVTFSKEVADSAMLKSLFKVTSEDDAKQYLVDSAEIVKSDRTKVNLTLKQNPTDSNVKVSVEEHQDETTGIIYKLGSMTGGTLENASITFNPAASYSLKVSANGQKLYVKVSSGKKTVTDETIGDAKIYLVALNSNTDIFGNNMFAALGADNYDKDTKCFVVTANKQIDVNFDGVAAYYLNAASNSSIYEFEDIDQNTSVSEDSIEADTLSDNASVEYETSEEIEF